MPKKGDCLIVTVIEEIETRVGMSIKLFDCCLIGKVEL